MFDKVGVLREVVVLAVLKDKDAVRRQQTLLEDDVRDGGQFLQRVWRVGKDNVELLVARLQKAEDVAANRDDALCSQFLQTLLDETVVLTVKLYTDDRFTSARKQFQRDAARAGKEVQGSSTVEVDILRQHIEDILLGKVRGRPCLEGTWNVEVAALVSSCDDAHGVNGLSCKA